MYRPIPKLAVYISLLLTLLIAACMLIAGAVSRAAIRDEVQNTSLVYLQKLDDQHTSVFSSLKGVVSNFAFQYLNDPELAAKLRSDHYEHFTLKRSIAKLLREYPQIVSVDVFLAMGQTVFHSSAVQTSPDFSDQVDFGFYNAAVASRAFVYPSGLRTVSEYAGQVQRYEEVHVYSIAVRIPTNKLESSDYAVFNIGVDYINDIAKSNYVPAYSYAFLFDAEMNVLLSCDLRTGAESTFGEEVASTLTAQLNAAPGDVVLFQYELDGQRFWATGARFKGGRAGLILVHEAALMANVYITLKTLALCFLALLLAGFGCSLFIDRKFFRPVHNILNHAGLAPKAHRSAHTLPLAPNPEFDSLDDYISAFARRYREQEKRIEEYFSRYRDNVLVSLLMGNKCAAAEFTRHGALMDTGYEGYLCALVLPDTPELTEEFASLGRWDRLEMPDGQVVYILSLTESMTPEDVKACISSRNIAVRVCLGDIQSAVEDIRLSYVLADKLAAISAGMDVGVFAPGDENPPETEQACGTPPPGAQAGRADNTAALVRQVASYIESHYMQEIGLSSIADYVYLSPSYLGRLFKEETGLSFTNYIIKVRMEKAAELLSQSGMKVSQVMEHVGYFSIQGFSRVFRSYYGCSPSEYRKRAITQALGSMRTL